MLSYSGRTDGGLSRKFPVVKPLEVSDHCGLLRLAVYKVRFTLRGNMMRPNDAEGNGEIPYYRGEKHPIRVGVCGLTSIPA